MITLFDKVWSKVLTGIAMAMIYSLLFLGIGYANGVDVLEAETLLFHLGIANIVGIIFSFASLVFEREEWNMLKQTIIHFIILLGTLLPIAIWVGWVPAQIGPIFIFIGSFILIYFIIWCIMAMYWKNKIKELNNGLK
ncbi:permease [Bacillus cereus]|uniref:Permease n=1 Tax=Bacillus cereus TaxID=1396 RepID=A0A2B0N482_BACCE|nr:permease [Bacillus cereus]